MHDWNEAEERAERARQLLDQRRWEEALAELEAALAINPYHAGWFTSVGQALDELGRHAEAAEAYREAAAREPADVQVLNYLGVALLRLGRHAEALEVFERIEQLDSTFEPSYCNRIIVYHQMGRPEKAEEMFYLARLYREHCPHCYFNMGVSLAASGRHEKAVYCWQKTLDLNDDHPGVHGRIAESLWAVGQLEQARRHYLIGLRKDPGNLQNLLDLGDLLVEMGHWEEAGEKFRRAIELAPENPSGHYCHGRWLLQKGLNGEAIQAFGKALQLDPSFPGLNLQLAYLHRQRDDQALIRHHLRCELAHRPTDPQILTGLAELLTEAGEERASLACLKRLVQIQPDEVSGWHHLAVAQFARRQYAEGIYSCHEALRCQPNNMTALYNLALACERVGQYDEGLRWCRVGLEHYPGENSIQRLELRLRFLRGRRRVGQVLRRLLGARV